VSHHKSNPVIPLPDAKIRKYAKRLASDLIKAAKSPERRTVKFAARFKAIPMPDGNVIDVPVRVVANLNSLPTRPLSVGHGRFSTNKARTAGTIHMTAEGSILDLDGSKFYEDLEARLARQAESLLRHEMTHALDPAWMHGAKAKYDERKARHATHEGRKAMGYYDDPLEVRAITREAVDRALDSAREWKRLLPDMRVVPAVIIDGILQDAKVARMRPANQKRVIKEATRAMQEAGLLGDEGPALRIDAPRALPTMGKIEGPQWLARQRSDAGKLRLPNGFYLNRSAWEILAAMGTEGEGLTLAELDPEAGLIAGDGGSAYVVEPGGEIYLLAETADRSKIAKASQVMKVIGQNPVTTGSLWKGEAGESYKGKRVLMRNGRARLVRDGPRNLVYAGDSLVLNLDTTAASWRFYRARIAKALGVRQSDLPDVPPKNRSRTLVFS
jgi:hypothetical protein